MAAKIHRSVVLLAFAMSLRLCGSPAPWYFLPNFGEDIRWEGRAPARPSSDGGTPPPLPAEAERLLSPDGGLSPDQREQVRWHEATFPQ
jgi:hypothetical protein